jgi:hypothetical protein
VATEEPGDSGRNAAPFIISLDRMGKGYQACYACSGEMSTQATPSGK